MKKESSDLVSKLKESLLYVKDENEKLKNEITNQITGQNKKSQVKINENEERILKIIQENEKLNKENMFLKKSLINLRLTSQIESGDKEKKQIEAKKSIYEEEIRGLNKKIKKLMIFIVN